MADNAYENALNERKALEGQKKNIDQRIAEIDLFLKLYQSFEGSPGASGSQMPQHVVPSILSNTHIISADVTAPKPAKGLTQDQFNEVVRDIIVANGHPMSRRQILEAFHRRQIHIGGSDEHKNISTKLWKAREHFVKLGGAYWLKSAPYNGPDGEAYRPEGSRAPAW